MRVAILGYGIEGQSAYRFFQRQGADITIFDEADSPKQMPPADVNFVGGQASFLSLAAAGNSRNHSPEAMNAPFDLIVRTPAVNPAKINAITQTPVTSVTQLFFEHCPAPIVGITGTKGKGTTASLLHAMLTAAGVQSWLVGNIGVPALDKLDEITSMNGKGVVIYELSSFQLWDMRQSPQVAVVLMIDRDHLDVHDGLADYLTAKTNIARWQKASDTVIFHPTNPRSEMVAKTSPGTHIRYAMPPAAHVDRGSIYINEQEICSISEVLLPGEHNLENICAALTAAWEFTHDASALARALRSFKGLEHRLETVRQLHDITYVNDSFSSASAATQVAIAAYQRPVVLIAGGYDRGGDFSDLAQAIVGARNLRHVMLMGQTRLKIASALKARGFTAFTVYDTTDFSVIVSTAKKLARPGDIVLLSPGCPSFDMFANFYERGAQFKALVQKLN